MPEKALWAALACPKSTLSSLGTACELVALMAAAHAHRCCTCRCWTCCTRAVPMFPRCAGSGAGEAACGSGNMAVAALASKRSSSPAVKCSSGRICQLQCGSIRLGVAEHKEHLAAFEEAAQVAVQPGATEGCGSPIPGSAALQSCGWAACRSAEAHANPVAASLPGDGQQPRAAEQPPVAGTALLSAAPPP